jgi:chromosomal replication initiation ATPase DnaA
MNSSRPELLKHPANSYLYRQTLKWIDSDESTTKKIRECIREVTGVDPYQDCKYRGRQFIKSRQLFFYFVRRYVGFTQYETGKLLDKDHATVVYAEKCVKKWNEIELNYKETFDTIERKIKSYENNRN